MFKTTAIAGKYNALMLIIFREIQYILQNLFYHNTNTERWSTPPEVTYHHNRVFREFSKLLFLVSALFFPNVNTFRIIVIPLISIQIYRLGKNYEPFLFNSFAIARWYTSRFLTYLL
jgi:hypothetical protein